MADFKKILGKLITEEKEITELHIGSTFIGQDEAKVKIIDIRIVNVHLTPDTWVEYEYELPNGKKGTEDSSIKSFKKVIMK